MSTPFSKGLVQYTAWNAGNDKDKVLWTEWELANGEYLHISRSEERKFMVGP